MAYQWKDPWWAKYYTAMNVPKTGFVIHHAIALTLDQIGSTFQSRQASAQWGVSPGWVQQYVPENAYAWHCGSTWGNTYLEGIECVNSALTSGYPVAEATVDTLVEFLVDRCRYRGIHKLIPYENIFPHKYFSATSCPGQLEWRIEEIANRVNDILDGKQNVWSGPGVEYAGATSYDTAEIIAKAARPNAETFLYARGENFADAAAGMWVVGQDRGQVLLRPGSALAYKGVYVGGQNRFGTNRVFNEYQEFVEGRDLTDTCFVCNGNAFQDAVAAAHQSYHRGNPIIFYEDHENFYKQIERYENVVAVGGKTVLPDFNGITERVAGSTSSSTAAALAERFAEGWSWINIATNRYFADGLAGAQLSGGQAFLYAEGEATLDVIRQHKSEITNITWLGGIGAVPIDLRTDICKAAGLL